MSKPWWVWKSAQCVEIQHFDVSFAVKEYLQNQVGQIQKEKRCREWSDWCTDDLRTRPNDVREDCKTRLVRTYPGLLTGPHGAAIRNDSNWLPIFVVSGLVPKDELKTPCDTDLIICTVLWYYSHPTTGEVVASALSFFNNHLDTDASFSTFVIDGATTNRGSTDAVGEKGKGFILASQYFYESVEDYDASEALTIEGRKWHTGVSFRVGHQVGELSWRHARSLPTAKVEKQLQVVLDDLHPYTSDQFLTKLGFQDGGDPSVRSRKKSDAAPKLSEVKRQAAMKVLNGIYKRRLAQRLSDRPRSSAQNQTDTAEPPQEICRVRPDEVSITVLGIPGSLSPAEAFSSVYGVIPPENAWRVLPQVDTPIYFFKSETPQPMFYHRDHLVRTGPTLNKLSINYRGNLDLSADRTSVDTSTHAFAHYKVNLSKAAHLAFEFLPDLAVEIALDILTDGGASGSTLSRVLQPLDTRSKETYRAAFITAWRILEPSLPASKILYPYPISSAARDLPLIKELGMIGRPVSDHIMSKILHPSGAYSRIHHHVEKSLLRAPSHNIEVPGMARLQRAIKSLLPAGSIDSEIVGVVNHKYSTPKIAWNSRAKKFVMRVPERCVEHAPAGGCSCWVGPYLFSAMDSWKDKCSPKTKGPSRGAICRAFMLCMDGEGVIPSINGDTSGALRYHVDDESASSAGLESDSDAAGGGQTPTPARPRRASSASEKTLAPNQLAGKLSPPSSSSEARFPQATNKQAMAVPPRSNLSGIFNGVIDLCQRGLQQAASVEAQSSSLQTESINNDAVIKALREQTTRQNEEIRQLRTQLDLKDAELGYTRGLLTSKWADGASKPVVS
ncbi:hypothetical protein FIBSPDRAFT_1044324 [Athelia psychrophila]|uniref:Uncharacterized protein n=1 Tax=Athelia psychrophila TaxID=1759441 RepID=A0A166JSA4_9AGAM|nr:hypothetical protein FIBSPDRAFT_1044324 [Fibularhizoctonia sp. CBS 109695]